MGIDNDGRVWRRRINPPAEPRRETPQPRPAANNTDAVLFRSRTNEFQMRGARQRDRLERLYGAGAGGFLTLGEIRLAHATERANQAYNAEYQKQIDAFCNPATAANPPRDLVEVSRRATEAYRQSLREQGFNPADVRGDSFAKTADYLLGRADDANGFSVLSERAIVERVNNQSSTGDYYVRIVRRSFLANPDARLTGSEKAWMAFPDELAGAKLNVRGIMQNVGYDDATVYNPNTRASDYVLLVTERSGQNGVGAPTWENLFDLAQNHPKFARFGGQPPQFWEDARRFSEPTVVNNQAVSEYKTLAQSLWDAQSKARNNNYNLSVNEFLSHRVRGNDITPYQAELFRARYQMQTTFGANENFAGRGWTLSPDGRIAAREQLVDNTNVADQPRHLFLELRDGDFQNPVVTETTTGVVENPLRLRGETRTGALLGGGLSAVTSLPEVFEQYRSGDYAGAAQTFVGNTALGTGVGAFSAAGEQIVGNRFADALNRSNVAQRGIDRLYANPAARSFVSQTLRTEASSLTATTFGSTVRTVAGRIGGAGVIGGVVNGAFSAYDQIGAYRRGEVTASQAIGTVTGEAAVGVGAGLAGAAMGAAIGSIIPGAGTVVGGVIGFGVGMVAGYFADKGLRGLGANTAIAQGVTATIDAGAELVGQAQELGSRAVGAVTDTFNDAAETVGNVANDVGNAISGGLKSMFGW